MKCLSNGILNTTLSGQIVDVNSYSVTVGTSSSTTITAIRYSYLIVDQTLSYTQITFADAEILTATSANWTLLTPPLPVGPGDFLTGVTSIAYISSSAVNFTFSTAALACTGTLNFTTLVFSFFNYREFACPATYNYFSNITNLCYTVCPPYMYASSSNMTCEPCYYSCYSCSNTTASSNCTNCSLLNFRVLTGTSCLCKAGYYENGVATCLACMNTCATCTNGTECESCSAASFRVLVGGQCLCMDNYINDVASSTCLPCSTAIANCMFCMDGPMVTCLACSDGYYLSSSGFCSPCPLTCLTCTSAVECTSCWPTFVLSNFGVCYCEFPLFIDAVTGTCMPCNAVILGCISCSYVGALTPFSLDPPVCLVCDINFVMTSTGTCVC